MTKAIKLFYSYSHNDAQDRDTLEKHLHTLKTDGLIEEWYDNKICPGDFIQDAIDEHMKASSIVLLLYSQEFISSEECKKEKDKAFQYEKDYGTKVIPIILKECSWQDDLDRRDRLALPQNGKPVSRWQDKDGAWQGIYGEIKKVINEIIQNKGPELKTIFKSKISSDIMLSTELENIYIFPELEEMSDNKNRSIDASSLKYLDNFRSPYAIISGDQQSGKTSLCHVLYKHYFDIGLFPILIQGSDIKKNPRFDRIISKAVQYQYEKIGANSFDEIEKSKKVLLIDDLQDRTSDDQSFQRLVELMHKDFSCVIVFYDEIGLLSEKITERLKMPGFQEFSIQPPGYIKRSDLIKKHISRELNRGFDENRMEDLKKLENATRQIDAMVQANTTRIQPAFVLMALYILATATPLDIRHTTYGHCYHAVITKQLNHAGVNPEDIDSFINFLVELSFFMFNRNTKELSHDAYTEFKRNYASDYNMPPNVAKLNDAGILAEDRHVYFRYVYIYYYYVGRYIAKNLQISSVRKKLDSLLEKIYLKDNANIIIFVTHHATDNKLLHGIAQQASSAFENFKEITFDGNETTLVGNWCKKLAPPILENKDHSKERTQILEAQDRQSESANSMEERFDQEAAESSDINSPLIQIRKSAKSIEIIGQILRNQYGSLRKDKLLNLFIEGQNVGLRLLAYFIELMEDDRVAQELQFHLTQLKGSDLTMNDRKMVEKWIAAFSYSVILGWIHFIVFSLGYDKLFDEADKAHEETNTTASELINLYIHTWFGKNLDIQRIKSAHKKFSDENNLSAIRILQDIVYRFVRMHNIQFQKKQKILAIFGAAMLP